MRSSILRMGIALLTATAALYWYHASSIAIQPASNTPFIESSLTNVTESGQTDNTGDIGTSTPSEYPIASSTPLIKTPAVQATPNTGGKTSEKPIFKATESAPEQSNSQVIRRIDTPYTTPPLSFEVVNQMARSSLVNILCQSSRGSLRPISGSGIIIDERGIVLTNAHVAQYILLSQDGRVDLACTIRTGSPAVPIGTPAVLYIPEAWIEAHASDITNPRPVGTGEHDYALLYIVGMAGNAPYVSPDTREAIGFPDDPVLTAAYPVEFIGGLSLSNLYPLTSTTAIQELLTLKESTADVLSLGGVIQAQSGSSGGAVVNQWGRLIGLITTTSEGATTGERDLHAITLSYIERSLRADTGKGLKGLLELPPTEQVALFSAEEGPRYTAKLLEYLLK